MQEIDQRARVAGSGDVAWALRVGARALAVEGDLAAARISFEQAYQAAQRTGQPDAMAEAAVGMGGLWVHEHRFVTIETVVTERMRHALSLVDDASPAGLRLRSRLAGEAAYRTGDPSHILAVLAQARRAGDPVALAEALSIAHHCLLGPGHGTRRRDLAAELIRVSSRTGRRSDRLMGLLWLVVDLFLDGDPHAQRRLDELRAHLARHDHLAIGYVAASMQVMVGIQAGDLDLAETRAAVALELGSRAGDLDATAWHAGQLVAIRWYQGRLPELLPMLVELVSSSTLSEIDEASRAALAVAAAQAGDRALAASALATLRGRDLADLPRSSSWLVTLSGVVEAAHLLADAETSACAYELLLPHAGLPMIVSLGAASFGSVHHALGVAALTIGDLDRAGEHFRAAVEANLALGHRPAVAASRARLEQALQLRLARQRPPAGPATCTRAGRGWRVRHDGRSAAVGHSVGMLHLAVLLANPGTEMPAVELASGVAGRAPETTQPVLDRAAVQQYRERLAELSERIDDPDPQVAAEATREHDWLCDELAASTGLGGRVRAFTGDGERARLAVGKAIRRAIDRIGQVDPAVGEHLRRTVRTGTHCSYLMA